MPSEKYSIILLINNRIGYKVSKFFAGLPFIKIAAILSDTEDIKDYCVRRKIPFYGTNLEYIKGHKDRIDFILSVQYKDIVPQEIIEIPRLGIYNLHFSLLPKNRGMYPVAWAILNGEKYTGVTLHNLINKIDSGDIILQKKVLIRNMNAKQLYTRLEKEAFFLIRRDIKGIIERRFKPKKQDEKLATYHNRSSIDFQKEKYIDISSLTPEEIEIRKRAFYFPPKQIPILIRGKSDESKK